MTEPITFNKKAVYFRISDHELANAEGFRQKGHYEHRVWTDEEVAGVTEARDLIERVKANRYIYLDYEELTVSEPPVKTWVPEETHEEWLARWRESKK